LLEHLPDAALGVAPDEGFVHRLFPNPSRGEMYLDIHNEKERSVSISIHTLDGRQITRSYDGVLSAGTHQIRLNLEPLPAGLYVYQIQTTGKVFSGKLDIRN
jgi:Secretion system C-terminal sorting domain